MKRLNVDFSSDGIRCSAWLYLPDRPTPAPVVVMAHGLGGTRRMRLDAFAERFSKAGYACLVFDYRHFGDSQGQPRQLLDIDKQLQDWASAIAFARARNDIDGHRVILWGTSFGGGHVLAAAARDKRIAAVISQCPFTDGLASSLALHPLSSFKVTALAIMDRIKAMFGLLPLYVSTAGKPGDAALMSAPDALPGYLKLHPQGENGLLNYVAARFALQIIGYFPGRHAKDLTCPVLFNVCETDSVAPAKATLKHAAKARKGEIKTYPDGHFEIYVGEAFERVVADQVDFLKRHIPLEG